MSNDMTILLIYDENKLNVFRNLRGEFRKNKQMI